MAQTAQRIINGSNTQTGAHRDAKTLPQIGEQPKSSGSRSSSPNTTLNRPTPTQNGTPQPQDKKQNDPLTPGVIFLSTITSLSFAANTFCAGKGISPDKLSDPHVFDNWSTDDIFWAVLASLCSFGINTTNHLVTYPNVKEYLIEQAEPKKFKENRSKNIFIILFALGAAIPAAYISYVGYRFLEPLLQSFLGDLGSLLGYGLAGAIGAFSFMNFFALRTYGIHNFFKRLENLKNYFQRTTKQQKVMDKINRLTQVHREQLNRAIENRRLAHKDDDNLYNAVLLGTTDILEVNTPENDTCLNQYKIESAFQYMLYGIAAIAAVLGSVAILPVFAQKLFDGTLAMADGITRQEKDHHVFGPTMAATVLCSIFSLATPMLYFVQIFLLAETLINTYKAISDPQVKPEQKALKLLTLGLLGFANYEACLGVLNIANGMSTKPSTLFSSTSFIGSLFAAESNSTGAILAAGGACGVNTKFTVGLALPPPTPPQDETTKFYEYLSKHNHRFFSKEPRTWSSGTEQAIASGPPTAVRQNRSGAHS